MLDNEIGARIRALREISDISVQEAADAAHVSEEEYKAYESGEIDVPMGALLELSRLFGAEMTDILSGGGPKLHTFSYVKSGSGITVERKHEYLYQHLAYNFAERKAEPFLVTVPYSEDEEMHINSHEGQEFNYCVEGRLLMTVDGQELILEPGDSLYFDSLKPHGLRALDGKTAKFLAIIL